MLGVNRTDCHAERMKEGEHPVTVTLYKVFIDRHEVHLLALDYGEVTRERRDNCLALTRLHFGNTTLVQHHSANDLYVERPRSEWRA